MQIDVKGPFVNLRGTWVRHDLIATAIQRTSPPLVDGQEALPYCAVVLTVPGYKTLSVDGTLDQLFHAIYLAQTTEEILIGMARMKGMQHPNAKVAIIDDSAMHPAAGS